MMVALSTPKKSNLMSTGVIAFGPPVRKTAKIVIDFRNNVTQTNIIVMKEKEVERVDFFKYIWCRARQ